MKKLPFTLILAAALCFAACGNNQNKKTEAVVEETECTESCCDEAAESCCGEECGENCGENCEKHNAEKTE